MVLSLKTKQILNKLKRMGSFFERKIRIINRTLSQNWFLSLFPTLDLNLFGPFPNSQIIRLKPNKPIQSSNYNTLLPQLQILLILLLDNPLNYPKTLRPNSFQFLCLNNAQNGQGVLLQALDNLLISHRHLDVIPLSINPFLLLHKLIVNPLVQRMARTFRNGFELRHFNIKIKYCFK